MTGEEIRDLRALGFPDAVISGLEQHQADMVREFKLPYDRFERARAGLGRGVPPPKANGHAPNGSAPRAGPSPPTQPDHVPRPRPPESVAAFDGHYDLDEVRGEVRKALDGIIASLTTAKDDLGILQAVRKGAAILVGFDNDPGYDVAVAHLQALACNRFSLDVDLIQAQIAHGIQDALEERARDGQGSSDDISDPVDDGQVTAERKAARTELDAAIDEMNRKYCVVNDGGSVLIFADRYDKELGRRVYDRMGKTGLALLLGNKTICTSISAEGKRTYKPIATVWLASKRRRTYDEVVFDPTTTESRAGKLNLWRGFGYEPKPGKWDQLKNHVYNIVCGGDDRCFKYLMGWMARAVQRPAEQGEVAVVMRGGKGAGKGILAHAMRKIFGQHGMYISKSKHLVGAFNAHLRDCVLLFADEAFFAGDKAAEGTLKSLITEEILTIEPKGQNVILSRNRLHAMMASNEEWVIPAGLDERRFLVLDVLGAHQGDIPYFAAIHAELESGGYEAMLYELLHYDIGNFDVRRVPGTAALDEQKKLTLSLENQWWHDVLARGYVYRSKHGLEGFFGRWHDWVSTEVLYGSYEDYAKSRNERYRMARASFGKFMNGMGYKPGRPRGNGGVTGEHQVRSDVTGVLRAELITKDRPPGYYLGTLEEARGAFEAYTKLPFDWDAEE